MNIKFLKSLFVLCLIFPCLFVFSACGEDDNMPTGITVQVNNNRYTQDNTTLYVDYGEKISFEKSDFSVLLVHKNGTKTQLDSNENYVINWEHTENILPAGTYELKILYQDFSYDFNVVVVQKVSAKPLFSENELTYNGQIQKPEILNENSVDWNIVSISEAASYTEYGKTDVGLYTLVISLLDKTKTAWQDGTLDDIVFNWQIVQKQVSVPTVLDAEFDEASNSYKLDYKFDNQTFEGISQGLLFSGNNLTDIVVSGNSALNAGSYVTTLSLNNKDGKLNYKWEGKEGAKAYAPITLNWEIEPFKFDEPYFESWITYRETNVTFDELIDEAKLTGYFSIMTIQGMTNGVFDSAFLESENPIVFKLPEDNLNFEWANTSAREITLYLVFNPIEIDGDLISVVTTGAAGSITLVDAVNNVYKATYNGASILDMFSVEISDSISSIVSYDKENVKCLSEDDLILCPDTTQAGHYHLFLTFEYDRTKYAINKDISMFIYLEKAQPVAGVDFSVPQFETQFLVEGDSLLTLNDLLFSNSDVSMPELYSWKQPQQSLVLGTNTYVAIYTPADTKNWLSCEFYIEITYKCVLNILIDNQTYTGQEICLDVSAFTRDEILLVTNENLLIKTEVGVYEVVFKIKDEYTESYCWEGGLVGEKVFYWEIVKANPKVPEFENVISVYVPFGQSFEKTLSDVSLLFAVDSGCLSWKNEEETVQLWNGSDVSYVAIYTPEDTLSFNSVEVEICVNLYIEVAKPALIKQSEIYTGNEIEAMFSDFNSETIVLDAKQSSNILNTNAGVYTYYFNLKENYFVWNDSHTNEELCLSFEIVKRMVEVPYVQESDAYVLLDNVYTFTYKYDTKFNGISQSLPLVFDSVYTQITSGSLTCTNAGEIKVVLNLVDSENCVWNNLEQNVQSFTFDWKIVKASAISVETPTFPVFYASAGSPIQLLNINFENEFITWDNPETYLSAGVNSNTASYCPDALNIMPYSLTILITFYYTINKPTQLTYSTSFTGSSQSVSFFTDLQFIGWGFNTYMSLLKNKSASTTQTDIGTYQYYFAPRQNYVWEDDKLTDEIIFTWSIQGVTYEIFDGDGNKIPADGEILYGYLIKIYNIGAVVYYKFSEPEASDYDSDSKTFKNGSTSIGGDEYELSFMVENFSADIYIAYYLNGQIYNLLNFSISGSDYYE